MHEYNLKAEWPKLLQPDIVELMTQIHEFKGEQNLFIEAHEDTLAQLMEIAKIQSTQASNKIEGIYTSDDRLKKIVMDKTMPRTRNEQEIAGYREVLAAIHENYDYMPIKPNMILQLHGNLCQFNGSSIGGKYKSSDNIIEEIDTDGRRSVRFRPVPAWETPEAIEKACRSYEEALQSGADPLLIAPMFILDFLCIHPFNDGNGRMSRLLTLLMMYQTGYIVGKYISVEKVIEQTKETYYEALQSSSAGWHDNRNDYAPFVRYMLGALLKAYREFSARVKVLAVSGLSKPDRIREVIKKKLGRITKAEIAASCPDIAPATIQRALIDLQKSGDILKIGGGRYTSYTWNWGKES